MSTVLRIALLIGILIYFFAVIFFLRRKRINLKYSLLWIFSAVVLLIIDAVPSIIDSASKLIGVKSPVNAIFLIVIFLILLILISLSSIVSIQHNQIKTLIQEIALLRKQTEDDKKQSKTK